MCQLLFVIDESNHFNLCSSAKKWLEVNSTLQNWKLNRFKKYPFPSSLQEPLFYSSGKTIAALETTFKLKIFSMTNDNLLLTSIISLPIKLSRSRFVEHVFADILINKDYLIYKNCNILITYQKTNSYRSHIVLLINNDGAVHIMDRTYFYDQFFTRNIIDDISCDFTYLHNEILWMCFSNGENEFHYLMNLITAEIRRIIPPTDGNVFHCTAAKDIVILEYASKIVVYNINGQFIFSKQFDEPFISLNTNGHVIIVFNPRVITVLNSKTGENIFDIPNEMYNPSSVYIHPNEDFIYLTKVMSNSIEVSAFNTRSEQKEPLWKSVISLQPSGKISEKYEFLYGVYLMIFIEHVFIFHADNESLFSDKIYFIDVRTGQIVYIGKVCELHYFKHNFFIKGTNPCTLYKVN